MNPDETIDHAELRRQTELRISQMIEQAMDGVFIIAPDGRFILANSRVCEMLGYLREELLQINILDTSGNGSFLVETRIALDVADTAVLLVSANEGVQVYTGRTWDMAEEESARALAHDPSEPQALFVSIWLAPEREPLAVAPERARSSFDLRARRQPSLRIVGGLERTEARLAHGDRRGLAALAAETTRERRERRAASASGSSTLPTP